MLYVKKSLKVFACVWGGTCEVLRTLLFCGLDSTLPYLLGFMLKKPAWRWEHLLCSSSFVEILRWKTLHCCVGKVFHGSAVSRAAPTEEQVSMRKDRQDDKTNSCISEAAVQHCSSSSRWSPHSCRNTAGLKCLLPDLRRGRQWLGHTPPLRVSTNHQHGPWFCSKMWWFCSHQQQVSGG